MTEVVAGAPKNLYVELILQVAGGSLAFVLVFIPAIGLDLLVNYIAHNPNVTPDFVFVLKMAKRALLFLDCLLGAIFMLTHVVKFARLAWEDLCEH